MKALTKQQELARKELSEEFSKAYDKLNTLIGLADAAIEKVNEAKDDVNSILDQMRELHEEITDTQQEFYDDKSEKWQESDAGEAYNDWKNEWSSHEIPENIEDFETLEDPDIADAAEEFENLPSAVNN